MKKSTILMFYLTNTLILTSCQKEQSSDLTGWNALTFTESVHNLYSQYMDEPYINLTFPSAISSQELNYDNGIFRLSDRYYAISAHNWDNSRIILRIIKDGEVVNTEELVPENNFAFRFSPLPGEYQFKAAVMGLDNQERPLKTIVLHNSENRLKVY